MDATLTGTTTQGQSGPGSNGNEGVLHIPQSSIIGASSSDDLFVISSQRTLDPQPTWLLVHLKIFPKNYSFTSLIYIYIYIYINVF